MRVEASKPSKRVRWNPTTKTLKHGMLYVPFDPFELNMERLFTPSASGVFNGVVIEIAGECFAEVEPDERRGWAGFCSLPHNGEIFEAPIDLSLPGDTLEQRIKSIVLHFIGDTGRFSEDDEAALHLIGKGVAERAKRRAEIRKASK